MLGQCACKNHALIVSTAAPVYDQERNACARLLIFNRAAAGGDQGAALQGARLRHLDIAVDALPDQQRSEREREDNHG